MIKDVDQITINSMLKAFEEHERPGAFKILKTVIDDYSHVFDIPFYDHRYSDTNKPIRSYVLPCFIRMYFEFKINSKRFEYTLADTERDTYNYNLSDESKQKVVETLNQKATHFKLSFDLEEFIYFLDKKVKDNYQIFDKFENIDRAQYLMQVICDDYVAKKYHNVFIVGLSKDEMRELKLKDVLDDSDQHI